MTPKEKQTLLIAGLIGAGALGIAIYFLTRPQPTPVTGAPAAAVATAPVKVLAKEKCDYLKFRACAKGTYYGRADFIDQSAREKYKKITGRFPICKPKAKKK